VTGRAYLVGCSLEGARLGVCINNRSVDEVGINGMAELLGAIHRGGNAPDLLLAGGTTLSQAIGDLYTWKDQRLIRVQVEGRPVTLTLGPEWRGDQLISDASYGCVKGADGVDDIVQVTLGWSSTDTGSWSRTVYRIQGAQATAVWTDSGSTPSSQRQVGASKSLLPGECSVTMRRG
jgi:hypothetical protein